MVGAPVDLVIGGSPENNVVACTAVDLVPGTNRGVNHTHLTWDSRRLCGKAGVEVTGQIDTSIIAEDMVIIIAREENITIRTPNDHVVARERANRIDATKIGCGQGRTTHREITGCRVHETRDGIAVIQDIAMVAKYKVVTRVGTGGFEAS